MTKQRYIIAVACLVLLGLAGFLFARYALPEGLSTAYAYPPDIHHEIVVNEFRGLFRSGSRVNGGVMVFAGAMRHNPAQGFLDAFYRDPPVYKPILFLPPRGTGALRLVSWQKLGSSFRLTAVTESEQSVTLDVPLPIPYARYSVRALQLRNQIRRF
jgi:hypothetical protein